MYIDIAFWSYNHKDRREMETIVHFRHQFWRTFIGRSSVFLHSFGWHSLAFRSQRWGSQTQNWVELGEKTIYSLRPQKNAIMKILVLFHITLVKVWIVWLLKMLE
jgi:hypothetical protein